METEIHLNNSHKRYFIILIILSSIAGIYFVAKWATFRINYVYSNDAQITGNFIPISSKVAGRIKNLYFAEGNFIKESDLLAKIDDEEYKLAVKRAEAELDEVKKELEKAQISYELAKKQKKEIDIADKTVKFFQAKVKTQTVQLELAKLNERETNVYSPMGAIISKKISQNYEYVMPGKPIYFINAPDDVTITANIEEKDIGRIKIGDRVKISVDAIHGKEFSGFIENIGTVTNSQFSLIPASNPSGQFIKVSQRISVKIRFNNIPSGVKHGMMVEVAIKTR